MNKSQPQNKKILLQSASWLLTLLVVAASVVAWMNTRNITIFSNFYDLFPLLGLLAFGFMWTHYIVGAIRRVMGLKKKDNQVFLSITNVAVLFLILLHPGLLIFQLFRDGYGLPPASYLEIYGANGMRVFLLLGSIALIIFLMFELYRFFSEKSWWKYVNYAQVIAMIFIFIHGTKLGRETSGQWFKYVWWFYLFSFLASLIYTYYFDYKQNHQNK